MPWPANRPNLSVISSEMGNVAVFMNSNLLTILDQRGEGPGNQLIPRTSVERACPFCHVDQRFYMVEAITDPPEDPYKCIKK